MDATCDFATLLIAMAAGSVTICSILRPRATETDLIDLREEVARLRKEIERLKRTQMVGSTEFTEDPR